MNQYKPDLEALKRLVEHTDRTLISENAPLIGISVNYEDGTSRIADAYVNAVHDAGGIPILIPIQHDIKRLRALVRTLDALLLTGGADLNPLFWGEEPHPNLGGVVPLRDEYDLILTFLARELCLPTFGICRGHQLLNVAYGGTLYQDLYAQVPHCTIQHSQKSSTAFPAHKVHLDMNTRLAKVFASGDTLLVNTDHHQSCKELAPGFRSVGVDSDGINEAMEGFPNFPVYSVQWHPERMATLGHDEVMKRYFSFLVEEAAIYHKAKHIHEEGLIVDSHCDSPMLFEKGIDLGVYSELKADLPKMEDGRIDGVFYVAYLPQKGRSVEELEKATQKATDILLEIKRQIGQYPNRAMIARTSQDLVEAKKQGKKAIFLGIENGYALGKDLKNLIHFNDLGVSYITLCHNGDNDICDSAKGSNEHGGLSALGKDVVREMNKLGIMIDVSHTSPKTVADVLKLSELPIIASHSSCRALCDHPRNLTDEQMKAIAASGGVIQICLYKGFINEQSEKASVLDAVRHIRHAVSIVGINHVGIGSDFDGDGELIGCRDSSQLINLTVELLRSGFSEQDLKLLWGANIMRVLAANLDARQS